MKKIKWEILWFMLIIAIKITRFIGFCFGILKYYWIDAVHEGVRSIVDIECKEEKKNGFN